MTIRPHGTTGADFNRSSFTLIPFKLYCNLNCIEKLSASKTQGCDLPSVPFLSKGFFDTRGCSDADKGLAGSGKTILNSFL